LSYGSTYEFLRSYTENISLGGVFFQTETQLPIGSKVDLTIELTPGKGLRAIGEVMWCRCAESGKPPGVGVRFVQMDPASREWLRSAVASFVEESGAKQTGDPKPAAQKPAAQERDALELEFDHPEATPQPDGRQRAGPLELELEQAVATPQPDGRQRAGPLELELEQAVVTPQPDGRQRAGPLELELELPTTGSASSTPVPGPVRVSAGGREEILDLGFGEFESADEGPIVGIDLGTSNSCASIVLDGKPTMLPLGDPELQGHANLYVLPSVVSYDDTSHVVVGQQAMAGLQKNARRTIFGAKRFIGRGYDSPAVHNMLSRFPYKIVPGPRRRVAVDINGRSIELAEVSAEVLRAIRQRCSSYLKRAITRAIITVPAYYNDNQRAAVVHAGRLAGLTVERVLNEPTAAAVAYGLTQSESCKVLVYDLGGGTFDVSIMDVKPNALRVLATAGDTFLGGEDFDGTIVEHVCAQHLNKTGKQLSRNSAALAVVKEATEKAKQRLSLREKTMVMVREALQTDGKLTRLEVEITRQEVEGLVAPLVNRTLQICEMALREAKVQASELSDVILVGGQTHMPYVRQRVSEHFGRTPRCDLNPDQVVALGAGLLSHISADDEATFQDVLSMSIGVAQASQFKPLLLRNTPVPCGKSFSIQVPRPHFDSYKIEVWQGDSSDLHKNECLGALSVNSVLPGPKDPVSLKVTFALSADCLLTLSVTNVDTNESRQVLLITHGSD
jgi:molecular chaperone DnaK